MNDRKRLRLYTFTALDLAELDAAAERLTAMPDALLRNIGVAVATVVKRARGRCRAVLRFRPGVLTNNTEPRPDRRCTLPATLEGEPEHEHDYEVGSRPPKPGE